MTPEQFFACVETDLELRGVGVGIDGESGDGVFVVEHVPSRYQTKLPFSSVEAHDWRTLRRVIAGEVVPQPLMHITRVVGYFSRIENWNKSKIGELRDRRKGDYAV